MSDRDYQDYPDHILIKTDTGVVELAITEYNHIYINGQKCAHGKERRARPRSGQPPFLSPLFLFQQGYRGAAQGDRRLVGQSRE